jgi:xanthine dehydrogenase YagS FAD-binding subunit
MIPAFAYTRATTVENAAAALAQPGALACAGGTDALGCLRDQVVTATTLVSLTRVEALRGIAASADGGVRIGALTTLSEIARHPLLLERHRALAQAARLVASPQLRNQGTLGGNLCQRPRCWFFRGGYDCARKGGEVCYAMGGDNRYHCVLGGSTCLIVHPSDTATALVALDAQVSLAGPRGARTLPLEQFFVLPEQEMTKENVLGPGEFVTAVTLAPPAPGARSIFRKVRTRGSWDFALAAVGAWLRLEGDRVREARIVLGAAAPIPWRARAAERALIGQRPDPKSIARAAAAAVDGASPLEHNGYKVPMLEGIVRHAIEEAVGNKP